MESAAYLFLFALLIVASAPFWAPVLEVVIQMFVVPLLLLIRAYRMPPGGVRISIEADRITIEALLEQTSAEDKTQTTKTFHD